MLWERMSVPLPSSSSYPKTKWTEEGEEHYKHAQAEQIASPEFVPGKHYVLCDTQAYKKDCVLFPELPLLETLRNTFYLVRRRIAHVRTSTNGDAYAAASFPGIGTCEVFECLSSAMNITPDL